MKKKIIVVILALITGIMFVEPAETKDRCIKGNRRDGNGKKYTGQFKNGKPDGKGAFHFLKKSTILRGNYKNGKLHGEATLSDKNGKILKKGYWKDGKFIGEKN